MSSTIMALALALLSVGRSSRAAVLLSGAVAIPALDVKLGEASVHLFVLIAGFWLISHPHSIRSLRVNRTHAAVVAACMPLVLTVAWGPFVTDGRLAAVLLGLALSSLVVSELSRRHRQRMSWSFVCVNTVGCCLSLLQALGAVSGELIHPEISALGRPSGWYGEPDWLGLFAAVNILICLYDRALSPRLRVLGLTFGTAALVLSFARAAWIGVAAGVVFHIVLAHSSRSAREAKRSLATYILIVAAGLLLVGVAVPSLRADLATRGANILGGGAEDVSARARRQQQESMLRLAELSPWSGGGLSSSGRVGVSGELILDGDSRNNVGSNWVLALWVDGKLLALPLFAAIAGLVWHQRGSNYWPAFVALLVSSLASNAFYFPLTWLIVGMLPDAGRLERALLTRRTIDA